MNYAKGSIVRGYTNRILCVDLAAKSMVVSELDARVRDYFLGGRSLGLYLLHKAVDSCTKATDPANPLILLSQPEVKSHTAPELAA
jgi:aldehyde:ferredoxin oxidoreductase